MKLFYIDSTNADGEDVSAFVIAEHDTQAVELWRIAEFVVNAEEEPKIFCVKPAQVTGPARVLFWHQDVTESVPEFIYVLTERGEPWTTTKSREHAFELCRKKFGMVSFSTWVDGELCVVSQNGNAVANIYCMEVAR